MASATVVIGALDITNYIADEGPDWGSPEFTFDKYLSTTAGEAVQANVQRGGIREISIPLIYDFSASTMPALRDALAALRDAVKPGVEVAVTPNGMAAHYHFKLLEQPPKTVPDDRLFETQKVARFKLNLFAEGYAYGDAVTLLNASSQTYPLAYSLSAMKGDIPAVLNFTGTKVSANGIANFRMAWSPDTTWTEWARLPDDCDAVDGLSLVAAGEDANDGDHAMKTASSVPGHADYRILGAGVQTVPRGTYRIIARARVDAGTGTQFIWCRETDVGSTGVPLHATSPTAFHLYDLGEVCLPHVEVRGASAVLDLEIGINPGTSVGRISHFYIIPTHAGYIQFAGGGGMCTAIIIDEAGLFSNFGDFEYPHDSSTWALALNDTEGRPVRALAGYLLMLLESAVASEWTKVLTTTLSYVPLYDHLPE